MENTENLKIYSEEVKDVLTAPPKKIFRWGNTILLTFIILIFILSYLIKYPEIIISNAILTTKVPPQKEYAKITGKIDTIFIDNNQHVAEKSVIAIIENTANYKDILFLKSVIDTIKLKKNSFSFPIKEIPILFLGEIEDAYSNFENNYIQYLLNKDLQPFSNKAIANKISNSELKIRLHNLKSQKKINNTELNFKKVNLDRSKSLFSKGVISAREYETQEIAYLQAKRNYENMNTSISQIRELIADSKKSIKNNEIERIREEMILLKNTIQSFNQLKKAIKDWEIQYAFISNINGKVSFMKYWTKNQTIHQNDLIFTIIPSNNSSYIAKLKTPSQNSGKIKVGQNVNLKLQNFPDYEFGILRGIVSNISVIPDEKGFYIVDVSLPKELITSYHKKIAFKHEMIGTAEIITEDLRLIERFFYQFKKLFNRS